MKYLLFVFLAFSPFTKLSAQSYWQQKLNYDIDVKLNDQEKTLDGFETIVYQNNSPDTLRFIWFHLWPNAFKNDRTAFSDQKLENGSTAFYFSDASQRGYINRLSFKVNDITAATEDHPQHIDITKLVLPNPLPPGEQITITTPFHIKLPYNFSRGGYVDETFQITQWYPKPAVYDQNGWHPIPYLDQGEFYSEFADYRVSITLPSSYVVAATGQLQDSVELAFLKSKAKKTVAPKTTPWKTLEYSQSNVHDFAWFANKDFTVDYDTCSVGNKVVDVFAYYTEAHAKDWAQAIAYAKNALRFYSSEVGTYPYAIASVVQGPEDYDGGMEYPTITLVTASASGMLLDYIIAHELGHNWFYGALASNERLYPWMDEGMNSFYTEKYTTQDFGVVQLEEIALQSKIVRKTDQPINTPADQFSITNNNLVAYHKTSNWMRLMEQELGQERFRQMMQAYYDRWQHKHPQPSDFKNMAASYLGEKTVEVFQLLDEKGKLPGGKQPGFKVISPFKKNSIKDYLQHPGGNVLLVSPAIGYNVYDGLMLGGLFTNYKLPPSNFQYLVAPLFGTSSGALEGLAKLNYSIISNGAVRKTDLFLNASRFAMNRFVDSAGNKTLMHFNKFVPGLQLTFREKNPRSTLRKTLGWKTYFISEQSLRAAITRVITGVDTSYRLRYYFPTTNRYLNQLSFSIQNFRALYPFDFNLTVQQGKDFVKAGATTNYFFNYAKGGGLNVRFFAGKFVYLNGRSLNEQIKTSRYHLTMSGPSGYEDYTYSNYFVGRNEFNNFWSRQLMIRDGGFKVQSELLSKKIGKSDDWLMAANFVSTIPDKLNPLSLLPVKIPLRLFADIGTYAEPWQNNSLDRFVFDAGINISLFRDVLNIYLPLVYSKEFGDYLKASVPGSRFTKAMTFSINFFTNEVKKVNSEIEF